MPTYRTCELECKLYNGSYFSWYCWKRKELEVTISADMKVSEQCGIAASMGKTIIGLIMINIPQKESKLIIHIHQPIVRPHL